MKTILNLLLFLSLFTSCIATGEKNSDYIKKNRELLKEYFFCSCIVHGFKNIQIEEYDNSRSVYVDIGNYSLEAFREVDSIAKEFVDTIEFSIIEDCKKKKNIIMQSINKYKNKETDILIQSMDKHMIEE